MVFLTAAKSRFSPCSQAASERCYFKGRNFRGQKFSRFSRILDIFAKVYAFENLKPTKRESFFREIMDNFKNAKVIFPSKKMVLPRLQAFTPRNHAK